MEFGRLATWTWPTYRRSLLKISLDRTRAVDLTGLVVAVGSSEVLLPDVDASHR